MRWIRFSKGDHIAYGSINGDTVTEVAGAPWADATPTGKTYNMSDVKIEIPVIPPTFYCAGINYATHIREMAHKRGVEPVYPSKADIGYRANNALVADGEDVVIPAHAPPKMNYEGELVVVIGKKAKHLTEANAFDCVFGYTIGNDVSERTWQRGDRTFWRGKNTDTFKPMGPWIETDVKLEDLSTTVRLNGEKKITFETNKMIHGVVDFLVSMTTCLTLYPGDVLWMGTEGATANMKHGDVCEIEISGIGTLSNPVVAEK